LQLDPKTYRFGSLKSGFVQSAVSNLLWALDLTSIPVLEEFVGMEEVEDGRKKKDGWTKVVPS